MSQTGRSRSTVDSSAAEPQAAMRDDLGNLPEPLINAEPAHFAKPHRDMRDRLTNSLTLPKDVKCK